MSVSGGVTGMFDSQEELSQDASDGVDFGTSSSSPEEVGKANKERAGRRGAGAGALRKQKREGIAWFGAGTLKALVGAIVLAGAQQFSTNIDLRVMQMSMIRISAAAGRVNGVPHASMQVALHVTMRQNGAKASNRVSVSGGVTGMFDSQEGAQPRRFRRWLQPLARGFQHQRHTWIMATAFDSALSYKALSNAWAKLYSKTKPISRNTIGVDDKSINDFQIDPKGNLVRLHKLLSSSEFKFSSLKPYLIPKANGKKRLICVPTVGDRIVQGAVLDFLSTKYANVLANSVSFGFIKGVGVSQAAKQARELRNKHPYVFKTDITSFFDSIPREQLKAAIKRIVRDRSLHPLLFEALSCEVAYNQQNVDDIDALGIKPGRGLRQGMPLSPFLSNVLLVKFDRRLDKAGLKAVRYADDLIFLCAEETECRRAARFCKEEFAKIGLLIPEIGPGSKSQNI